MSSTIAVRAPRLKSVLRAFMTEAEASAQRVGNARRLVDLKRDHSLRVMALVSRLLKAHSVEPYEIGIVAALLHDVGRFSQFEQYRTFRDAVSIDHGAAGAAFLAASSLLDAFSASEKDAILRIVSLHNRRALPVLDPPWDVLLHAVRDADKLDIVRVVLGALEKGEVDSTVTLGLRTEPGVSPGVLQTLSRGEAPDYGQLVSVDDFKLFLAAWSACLSFQESRRIFVRRRYLQRIWAVLPQTPPIAELFQRFADALRS
jgi:hypothetical protein